MHATYPVQSELTTHEFHVEQHVDCTHDAQVGFEGGEFSDVQAPDESGFELPSLDASAPASFVATSAPLASPPASPPIIGGGLLHAAKSVQTATTASLIGCRRNRTAGATRRASARSADPSTGSA